MNIENSLADIHFTTEYKNTLDQPVEVIYEFPTDKWFAVCSVKAIVDEWEILTKITEKEEAKQNYSDAVASGNFAVKVSYDEEVADILSIHIGQLPPHKSASVEVVMVSMLSAISAPGSLKGYFNFTFPRAFFPASHGTENGHGTFAVQIRLS